MKRFVESPLWTELVAMLQDIPQQRNSLKHESPVELKSVQPGFRVLVWGSILYKFEPACRFFFSVFTGNAGVGSVGLSNGPISARLPPLAKGGDADGHSVVLPLVRV